jgi:3-dehydroquinate synthase
VAAALTIRYPALRASSRVHLAPGALDALGPLTRRATGAARVVVVSDARVARLHGGRALRSLRRAGLATDLVLVPRGEHAKRPEVVLRLWARLSALGLSRRDAIVALGGGAVGDLAGFVAATWLRGVAWVCAPTTVLAQVDSSVGGKTGVNLPEGKNLVGAFHQPRLVAADVLTLRTLAERDFRSGLAEVVKHGMIADPVLFQRLEEQADRILARDPPALQEIVRRSCAIKARVVEADEREAGLRAMLNFGHTVGHAVEAARGYGAITHGEAVAQGMLVAAALSVRRGLCPEADAARLRELLNRFGLLGAPLPSPESLETYMVSDKKARDGVVQFVLTRGVGSVTFAPISEREELRRAIQDALGNRFQ